MDLETWRAQRQQQLVLSSGLHVTVRRVTLLTLAEHGDIPAPLVGQVEALITQKAFRFQLKDIGDMRDVLNIVVAAVMVAPILGDEPGDDTLGIDEIDTEDKLDIFNWALSGVAPLAMFPGDVSANGEYSGHTGPALRSATEQPVDG
jgi:hypothetical protein